MKRRKLRKSEVKDLSNQLSELYDISFDKKEELEEVEIEDFKAILKDKKPIFFYNNKKPIPTLKKCLEDCPLRKVIIDMGAVKFVTSGADIMRPGISEIDDNIEECEFVVIKDEKNQKPLAIAKAIYSGHDIKYMKKGKVLENLHYIGDELWSLEQ